MKTFAYIDAANLYYGGQKSLGWSIDYKKLHQYLVDKYQAEKVYFFTGVEIHRFSFDYLKYDSVPLIDLERYLISFSGRKDNHLSTVEVSQLHHQIKLVKFYRKLEQFGYQLVIKPVKLFSDETGRAIRKANCDVDLAFQLMRDSSISQNVIILSGDGDFLPVLKYLRTIGKIVTVLARADRTANEIKLFAGKKFSNFSSLKELIQQIIIT